jgi:hypothetical protein
MQSPAAGGGKAAAWQAQSASRWQLPPAAAAPGAATCPHGQAPLWCPATAACWGNLLGQSAEAPGLAGPPGSAAPTGIHAGDAGACLSRAAGAACRATVQGALGQAWWAVARAAAGSAEAGRQRDAWLELRAWLHGTCHAALGARGLCRGDQGARHVPYEGFDCVPAPRRPARASSATRGSRLHSRPRLTRQARPAQSEAGRFRLSNAACLATADRASTSRSGRATLERMVVAAVKELLSHLRSKL